MHTLFTTSAYLLLLNLGHASGHVELLHMQADVLGTATDGVHTLHRLFGVAETAAELGAFGDLFCLKSLAGAAP